MRECIPIRHHYIPRFLLRPFCFEQSKVYYYDKKTLTVSVKDIGNVFMVRNLYQDYRNHPEEPTQIELDLSKYENKMARIIKKFSESDEIVITLEENEKLNLFFAIMGLRAKNARDSFGVDMKNESKVFFARYLKQGEDFTDLWRRNLGVIVNCRSISEVYNHPLVDEPFKVFMARDTIGYFGKLFVVVQSTGTEEFIMSDCYVTDVTGFGLGGIPMPMYSIFPISPKRAIILFANGIKNAPPDVIGLTTKSYFKKPIMQSDQKSIQIFIRDMAVEDIKRNNKIVYDAAIEGVVFRDRKTEDIIRNLLE